MNVVRAPAAVATLDHEQIRVRQLTSFLAGVPEHVARLQWDAAHLGAHREQRLRALLARAKEHSPFHAARLRDVDPSTFTVADLPGLPTMTKSDLMSNFDDVSTDRRLTRAVAEGHLGGLGPEPSYLFGEFLVMASGGSSGERGVFVYRIDEFNEFAHAVVRTSMSRLQALGVTLDAGIPMAVVAAGSTVHGTGLLAASVGRGGPIEATLVPANQPLGRIVATLNERQPVLVTGYPSILERLARQQQAGQLDIRPLGVTCTSEPLSNDARAVIEATFGVPVVNTFASTEGLIGNSDPGDAVVNFATDLALVELVDADGVPVGPGVPSNRVLVTNLFNHTQPLIRYELTDSLLAEPGSSGTEGGFLRATADGRSDDMFRFGDVTVHPLTVRSVLVGQSAVREYQVRQTDTGIDVDVVATGPCNTTAISGALSRALTTAGLRDAAVRVRAVPSIKGHPQTGKVRRFVPLPQGERGPGL